MPRIIVGSSDGSLVTAIISFHKYEELRVLSEFEIIFGKNALGWNLILFGKWLK
jgi:predicted acylesterase/phospholipase RssA